MKLNAAAISKHFSDYLVYWITEAPRGLDFSRNEYPYPKDSERIWYERTTGRHINELFDYFEDKNRRVLDIGCGKGYALYKISRMGFTRVDGVEFERKLADTARRNFEKLGIDKKIQVFNMDVRDFDGYDHYDVIYMFHPFKESIMRVVANDVEESLRRCPRPFTIVYFHPMEHKVWDESRMFYRSMGYTLTFVNAELDAYYYEFDPNYRKKAINPAFKKILETAMKSTASSQRPRHMADT